MVILEKGHKNVSVNILAVLLAAGITIPALANPNPPARTKNSFLNGANASCSRRGYADNVQSGQPARGIPDDLEDLPYSEYLDIEDLPQSWQSWLERQIRIADFKAGKFLSCNAEAKKDRAECVKPVLPENELQRYNSLAREVISYSRTTGKCGLVVNKAERAMSVYCGGTVMHSFRIELSSNPYNDKEKQGDLATPEGIRKIKGINPKSEYYKGFLVDYPNNADWKRFRRAKQEGAISQGSSIGGAIMLHGQRGKHVSNGIEGLAGFDWTAGCIAVCNSTMDILFDYAKQGKIGVGTPIAILKYTSLD